MTSPAKEMSIRLDCADTAKRLDDFIEDAVAGVLRKRIEDHLAECPECARAARALRQTRSRLQTLPPLRLTPDRRERVIEEFRKHSSIDGCAPRVGETPSSPRSTDASPPSGTPDSPQRSAPKHDT